MQEIFDTGYWNAETAHIHHVHSNPLAMWISNFLKSNKNKQILDFGCGLGLYLKQLQTDGFNNLLGVEGQPPVKKEFENIIQQDLTVDFDLGLKGTVICLEVGEHIPMEYEHVLLNNITKHCDDFLIMSWAVRGQAGFGHLNCLDNHEVIIKMQNIGFDFMDGESMQARNVIDNTTPWFKNTILIFKKV